MSGSGNDGESVRCVVRVRPPNQRELDHGFRSILSVLTDKQTICLHSKPDEKRFTFDFCGDATTTQDEMFARVGKPISETCLTGYNGTIFAYGQTGSGKTHTIAGPSLEDDSSGSNPDRGLLPRVFDFIFSQIAREALLSSPVTYSVKASYLEIYQERPYDLLEPDTQNLNIREDAKKGVYVENLHEIPVQNATDALKLAVIGAQNRRVAATAMNRESSRSHALFCLTISSKEVKDGVTQTRTSRFHLCDLAGSERQGDTKTAGTQLQEAGAINKSLSVLGNVIMALVDLANGKHRHVHYRDSKLTFLLKDSLGGNSMTYIIANVSPAEINFGETLSTLKFAARAKFIKNKAIVNEDSSGSLSALQEENRRLRDQLRTMSTATVPMPMSPGGEVSTPKNDDSVLGVRGFNQMHRWASRQSELHAENRRLRDQTKAFTELVAAYEHQLQSLKLVVRLRVEENEKLRNLNGDRSVDDKALHALQTQLETLQQELVAVRQSAELPPAAIDWCLRFMLLQDTVETRAPWILLGHSEEEDVSQFRVPPAVQQQLAQERARNEELANEVRALADKFLKLKTEQDANFTSSPDRLWRSLPDAFKNQIHEVREGHAAKTTMTVKLDKAKDEINALKIRVREFDELRAELDSVRFEVERAKTAHQKEMSSTRKENEARIERLIEDYTAKIQASTGDADAAVQRSLSENLALHARSQQLESALSMSKSETQQAQRDHQASEERLSASQQSIARLQAQLAEAQTAADQQTSAHNKVVLEMIDKMDTSDQALRVAQNSIAQLNAKLAEAEKAKDDGAVARRRAEEALSGVQETLRRRSEEADAAAKQAQELSFRLELLDEDNDTLQQDNNLLKQNLKVLGDELQAARSAAADSEAKYVAERAALQQQLSDAKFSLSTREQSDSEQVRLLQQQVEQLSADLEQANIELASAQHQTEEVSAQLRSTAQSLTESSKKEQNLTEALQRVSERNDVLVVSLQKSKEECQQYQTQVSHLTTTLSRTELSLSDKQAALLESQQESKQLTQTVGNLRQELDALTAQHEQQTEQQTQSFEAQLASVQKSLVESQQSLTDSRAAEKSCAERLSAERANVDRLNTEIASLRSQLSTISSELQVIKTEKADAEQAASALKEANESLRRMQAMMHQSVEAFMQKSPEAVSTVDTSSGIGSLLGRLRDEGEQARQECSDWKRKAETAETQLHAAQKAVAQHEQSLKETNNQLTSARSQLHALQRDYDDQELALGRLEQRLEQELNKAKERAMLLTRAEEKLAALEGAKEGVDEQLAALQSEHEIATDSLRAELEESQQQARELEQQYSDMENDVAQWRERCEGSEQRVIELESHINSRCLDNDKMAQQLQVYIQAEGSLFAEREAQSEEIRRLRSRVASLERDLARTHSELEEEAAAKFKLAQSKNHLQRIHLLEDTKQKLDMVSKELLAERAKFMNFSARMRKMADKSVMAAAEADLQSWMEQADQQREQQLARAKLLFEIASLLDPSFSQESFGDDELLVELSDAQLSSLLDRLKELLEQNASVTRQFDECQRRLRAVETADLVRAQQSDIDAFRAQVRLPATTPKAQSQAPSFVSTRQINVDDDEEDEITFG